MKIGILLTGHAPDALIDATGDYDLFFQRLLDGHGFAFETWAVVYGQFPPDALAADGWLITGSRYGAYEDHDWIAPLEQLVRDIQASGRPMVGICFGHQIIAQALGGRVEKYAGGWSVGRVEYDTAQGPVAIQAWHQDQVTELPDGARVLGSNATCANAVLAYGDHIWTVQPHPEFANEAIDGLIRTRGKGVVPDPLLAQAHEALDTPTDRWDIAAEMADFFLTARKECAA